jgi:AcrR family transcriptional regulator
MTKSAPHAPKKRPQQTRSRLTFEAILEAATRILSEDGHARFNTNRIAQRAGVAVASLYQYFPNKEAIVNALFQQELSEERREFATRSVELKDHPVQEAIRVGVRSTIGVHARRPKLVKSILEAIPVVGGAEAHARARQQVVDLVRSTMHERREEIRSPKNLDMKAFIVVHAVESVIHGAAGEHPAYLEDPAFAEQLIELVERFLLDP